MTAFRWKHWRSRRSGCPGRTFGLHRPRMGRIEPTPDGEAGAGARVIVQIGWRKHDGAGHAQCATGTGGRRRAARRECRECRRQRRRFGPPDQPLRRHPSGGRHRWDILGQERRRLGQGEQTGRPCRPAGRPNRGSTWHADQLPRIGRRFRRRDGLVRGGIDKALTARRPRRRGRRPTGRRNRGRHRNSEKQVRPIGARCRSRTTTRPRLAHSMPPFAWPDRAYTKPASC
jgi:hypothetical protein